MQRADGHGGLNRLSKGERHFTLPIVALVFGAGVWLGVRVSAGLWPLWLLAVAGVLGLILWRLQAPFRYACLPLVLMVALFLTQAWLHPTVPKAGRYNKIVATVYGEPIARSGGRIAFILCNLSLDGAPQSGRAYCTLQEDSGLLLGDLYDGALLQFTGSVYHPSGKVNAYDFDFRLWLLQDGIGYGITGAQDLRVLNTPQTAPWANYAARIRVFCREQLTRWMGDESSLAMAMLLGDTSTMEQDDQLAFRNAGVAHLMSVSGLHVGLLAGALSWLLTLFYIRKSVRLPILAIFLVLYCGITGFAPASQRAAIMGFLVLLGEAAGRKPDPLALLATAALIVLVIHPLELFSAGFVLSFTAMAGILFLCLPLLGILRRLLPERARDVRRSKTEKRLWRLADGVLLSIAVSLSAQAGVLLPMATYFHQLPLYGLLFNLLAVPLAGFLVPLYAVLLLLSLLPWIGAFFGGALGWVAQLGSRGLLALTQCVNLLPYAQIRVPSAGIWAYGALGVIGLVASRYVRITVGKRLAALVLALTIACGGAWFSRPATLRYHQFAVGQGDASLLIDGDQTIAIDVGVYGSEITNRLLAEGRDLDALILTHLHLDHAQGVSQLLANGIRIGQAYVPVDSELVDLNAESLAILQMLKDEGIPITYLSTGDSLRFHDVQIDVLWPQAGHTRLGIDANDRSLVTLIHLGTLRILNMGDESSRYEHYAAVACDVLKVAHHGSADSTTEAFLSIADPGLAMVTCKSGAALPAEETLTRLAQQGARVLRTDETGEIILTPLANGCLVQQYFAEVDDEP